MNQLLSCIGKNRHIRAVLASFLKLDGAIAQGEQGVVSAHTHVVAGVVDGATLTHDDVTGDAMLTTKNFHA